MSRDIKRFEWGMLNTILLVIALILITAGYIIMRQNDITISPVLLLLAYVVLIPLAIILKGKKPE